MFQRAESVFLLDLAPLGSRFLAVMRVVGRQRLLLFRALTEGRAATTDVTDVTVESGAGGSGLDGIAHASDGIAHASDGIAHASDGIAHASDGIAHARAGRAARRDHARALPRQPLGAHLAFSTHFIATRSAASASFLSWPGSTATTSLRQGSSSGRNFRSHSRT